jgi:hypothetical protein
MATVDFNDPAKRAAALDYQKHILRIRSEAKHAIAIEERGTPKPLAIYTLRDLLAEQETEDPWTVADLQPTYTRVMLAAQFKSGKTTLIANLIRSLLDGDLFLGKYAVAPLAGMVVLLDFEMSKKQLKKWYREHGIKADDRLVIIPMRGMASNFDLTDKDVLATWVARLKALGATYLIIDCLRPILDALGLDENHDTGQFLTPLDTLLVDASCLDCCVVHHMGHTEERTRGDSRLRDWPDVEWRMVRKDDDPASARYFTAFGRDVEISEQQLGYDVETRRLTIIGGSRKSEAANAALAVVIQWIKTENDKGVTPTQNSIAAGLKDSDYKKPAIVAAIKLGIKLKRIATTDGPNRAKLHSVLELRSTVDVTFEEMTLTNDDGQGIPSVLATCSRCQHTTESFGTKEPSRKRCLALMSDGCPHGEKNFYVENNTVENNGVEM